MLGQMLAIEVIREMNVTQVTPVALAPREQSLRETAEKLEAAFLSEMLKAAGLGEARGAFGGGAGEEQFSSFLRDEQARAMTAHGGIGLAQSIFEALKGRVGDAG
jgi:Rod binding domain-containing protein